MTHETQMSALRPNPLAGAPGRIHPVLPGEAGVWVFVLVDLIFFGLLFLSFVVQRAGDPGAYASAQSSLDVGLGLANTLILLTSSWLVALAVHCARVGERQKVFALLVLAVACGLSFVGVKIVEYAAKFRAGVSMLTNEFFMFYFFVTAIHFIHVLAGIVVLAVIATKARQGAYRGGKARGVETGAIYWHMVDLLWVMIFPLFYLVNQA